MRRAQLSSFCLLAALVFAPAALVRAADSSAISDQREDNKKWKQDAEKKQQEYYNKAREYEQDKKYSNAIAYYRRVLNVDYYQWDIRKKHYSKTEGVEEDDEANLLPALRRVRSRLNTSLNDQAEKRIEALRGQQKTDSLSEIEKEAAEAYKNKEYGKAYEGYKDLLEAAQLIKDKLAESFANRAKSRLDQIEKNAVRILDSVERSLKAGRGDAALTQFKEYEQQYGPFEASEALSRRYAVLTRDPALKKVHGEADAKKYMAQAEEYLKAKLFTYAYYEYQLIKEEFAGTDAAQAASKAAQGMEENQETFVKIYETPRERYARELIRRADAALKDNDTIGALRLYRHVARRFTDCMTACNMANIRLRKFEPEEAAAEENP